MIKTYRFFTFLFFQISLVLLGLFSREVYAADYYFSSSTGSDDFSIQEAQSYNTPWASIQKLNEMSALLKAGDRILFKRGDVFHGTIRLTRGGSLDNPIYFDAYGEGERPVITSLVEIVDWVSIGDGLYQAQLTAINSENLNVVLLEGEIKEKGRYPNAEAPNSGFLSIKSLNNDFSISGAELPFNAKGGEIVIRKNQWVVDTYPVKESNAGRVDFWNQGNSPYKPLVGFGYFIQNHPLVLDKFGEWSYSKTDKVLTVYFGDENPSNCKVEIATANYLMINDFHVPHLSFSNLHFRGANKNLLNIEQSRGVSIDQCLLQYAGENAIYSYGTPDFIVSNNTIQYSLNGGIFFWHTTPNASITDNVIEHTMPFQGMSKNSDLNGIGIYIAANADGSQIIRNKVLYTGYNGIHFGGDSTVVKNNLVDTYCLWKQDGGGIYMNSDGLRNRNNKGRQIIGNIVLNGVGSSDGTSEDFALAEGIYLDDNTSGVLLKGNTIAHINGKGIYLHNANAIQIEENLVYDTDVQLKLSHDQLGTPIRNVRIEGNYFSSIRDKEFVYSFTSIKDDIGEVGIVKNNYFLDPYNQHLIVETKKAFNAPANIKDLQSWQKTYNYDLSSTMEQMNVAKYDIAYEKVLKNSDVSSHKDIVAGIYNADSEWGATGEKEGALAVVPNNEKAALVYIQLGKLSIGEQVLLEMNVKSLPNNKAVEVFLEKSFDYNQVEAISYFNTAEDMGRIKVLLSPLVASESESLVLRVPTAIKKLWIDKIKVSKVRATNKKDQVFFRYNYSEHTVEFPLDGTYKSSTGELVKDQVVLAPYKSILLVKQ